MGEDSILHVLVPKRMEVAPCYKPKVAKSVHRYIPLQDGKPDVTKEYFTAQRLHDQDRSKRCLSNSIDSPTRSKVPSFSLGTETVPVLFPSIWPGLCTKNDSKTSKISRPQASVLPRRYPSDDQFEGSGNSTVVATHDIPRGIGFCNQQERVF